MPVLKTEDLIDNRIGALRQAHMAARTPRAELDLSGGIDSAVMACLLVEALGPNNVTLVHTNLSTSSEQTQRAQALAQALDCPFINGQFSGIYNSILDELLRSLGTAGYDQKIIQDRIVLDPTILGSIRSTLRAPLGRAYNRLNGGGLRHGTGNECEDRYLRFYQKGGDGEVDSNPLAMLSKGEVYQLAVALGKDIGPKVEEALRPIIEAIPSPDLWGTGDGHSDETELLSWTGAPFTYSRVNPETGEYTYVGTIERVSRFLDTPKDNILAPILFNPEVQDLTQQLGVDINSLIRDAPETNAFKGFDPEDVKVLLKGAIKAEYQTRHKVNPNIPTYGTRRELLDVGILTNELPVL